MYKPNCCASLKTCNTGNLFPQTRELSRVLIHKLLITNHNFVIPVGVTYNPDRLEVLMPRRGPSWIQSCSATLKIAGFHATVHFRYGNHQSSRVISILSQVNKIDTHSSNFSQIHRASLIYTEVLLSALVTSGFTNPEFNILGTYKRMSIVLRTCA